MSTYFNMYYFVVLCGLVLETQAQHLNSDPIFYKYIAETNKLRCNCEQNNQCDKYGRCTPEVCAKPYVGVNCQHASIEMLSISTTNVLTSISDDNEKTCLSSPIRGVVRYTLNNNIPIHFVWVYISWKDTYHMKPDLKLYKNNAIQSSPKAKYLQKLSNKSALIKLRGDVMYDTLELSDLPAELCSLEISIGRNVAFSSFPSQSSVYLFLSNTTGENALRAVDGSDFQNDTDSELTHCTATQFPTNDPIAWWQIRLRYDAHLNSVIILNRHDYPCRIVDAVVTFRDWQDNWLCDHRITTPLQRYTIPVETNSWVKTVRVEVNTNARFTCTFYGMLTLCEVYVYGEFKCPANKYGPMCDIHCPHCPSREKCDPDWGCTEGCNDRVRGVWCDKVCRFRYGSECQHECSNGCGGHGECDNTTGICFDGCRKGFFTPRCSQPCLPETYGENCSNVCSGCKMNETSGFRPCDRETGECDLGCDEGREGDKCEGIIILDPLYKEVGKVLLKVMFGVFCLLLIYKSFRILDDASSTEEIAEENDGSKIADEKDDTETVQPETVEQPELMEIVEPNPITRALTELREIVENESISRALTEHTETAENESIEMDRYSSSRSQGTSSATSKSSVSDSSSTATPGSERGFHRKNSLFAKFHALIAQQKKVATEDRP